MVHIYSIVILTIDENEFLTSYLTLAGPQRVSITRIS